MSCDRAIDLSLGPWAGPNCRGGNDFTILFEAIFCSYVPCSIFLLGHLWQGRTTFLQDEVVRSGALRLVKLTVFILLLVANVAFVISLGVTARRTGWKVVIGAAVFEILAALCALLSANKYHQRSARSSTWLTFWLACSCILALAIVRTQWLLSSNIAASVSISLVVAFKALALIAENWHKKAFLRTHAEYSPEELASPIDRIVFGWIIPLLHRGYRSILVLEQLTPISADLKESVLAEPTPLNRTHKTLFQDVVMDMPRAFFAPVIARIFLMGFSLAQPFLIYATLNYIINPFTERNDTRGSFLIFAYVLVFVGFALSNALYWYLVVRLKMKARSRLIELIYDCTYKSNGPNPGNNAAVSLMTIDVETAMIGFDCFHENWASILQIAAAVGILATIMSWACVAPIAACLGALIGTIPVVIFIQPATAGWNSAATERITMITAIIGRLKDLRLLGLGGTAFTLVQRLRDAEIEASKRFRKLLFHIITISQSPLGLSPLVTFALYAIQLDNSNSPSYVFVVKAFTALNLIGLIVTPFTNLLQALPVFGAGMASLYRIQQSVDKAREAEKVDRNITYETAAGNALELENVSLGWSSNEASVRNISLQLKKGDFLAVTGPVASGKSTFLAGLLDVTPQSTGRVARASRNVSYCPQVPWIMSGTVRDNITCGLDFDQAWYDTTIAACALAEDVQRWERGDFHDVGNDGNSLSGGQRQRLALARAVYARNRMVLLDDTLSGLDSTSSQHIQQHLLGPQGLFRQQRTTVIMVTHMHDLIISADQVLILAKGGSVETCTSPQQLTNEAREHLQTMTALQDIEHRSRFPVFKVPQHGEDTGQTALALAREDIQRKTGDWGVYSYYMKSSGRLNSVVFLLGSAGVAVGYQLSLNWIKWWSEDILEGKPHSIAYYLGYYGLIAGLTGVALNAYAGASMVFMVSKSASRLHNALLRTVARASVSYFDNIDSGVTVNRFNQDLRLIDFELPLAMVNTVGFAMICLTQAIVIACASRYMALAIMAAVGILIIVQRFYLRTSRQLRLLDIEAKAPLYTNFHETIQGIAMIRAYGERLGRVLKNKQIHSVNTSQQPMFLLGVVQRWLSLVIDLVVAILATVLITLVVKVPSLSAITSLGVGLVNLTLFNQFVTFVIRFWTELENALGAISRVKNFSSDTPAASGWRADNKKYTTDVDLDHLPAATPDIVFEQASIIFDSGRATSPALTSRSAAIDSVNLITKAGTKLGIVGRSGSGKSTLLSALCRITPLTQGTIRIGGVDISTMDQEEVQSRLICVTQSFLFLPNLTLRENLDLELAARPIVSAAEQDRHDNDIEQVLKDLDMWTAVHQRDGLSAKFDSTVWSTGELQILNLARAVLKSRRLRKMSTRAWKILLLDEVTGSVDRTTESRIRSVIRSEFVDFTVLAIEHRLEGVIDDLDWIVRLDNGQIVAQGRPDDIVRRDV